MADSLKARIRHKIEYQLQQKGEDIGTAVDPDPDAETDALRSDLTLLEDLTDSSPELEALAAKYYVP